MTIPVRQAQDADRGVIEAIIKAAYSPYIARTGRKPGPMLDDYAALICDEKVHVVTSDGKVRGLVVLMPKKDCMLLDNIAVAPSSQGRGFGRVLLEFAETTARKSGYQTIRLYTQEAMVENIALYSRIGYRETHRCVERGYRRIYMEKPIG